MQNASRRLILRSAVMGASALTTAGYANGINDGHASRP